MFDWLQSMGKKRRRNIGSDAQRNGGSPAADVLIKAVTAAAVLMVRARRARAAVAVEMHAI